MELKDIKLWKKNLPDADLVSSSGDPNNKGLPTLTPYLLEGEKLRPAIIVCPGGSFQFRASIEGEPIAKWLNQIGINTFVLNELNLPFELHIFSKGPHGLGLGENEPTVAIWPKLCENWLKELF